MMLMPMSPHSSCQPKPRSGLNQKRSLPGLRPPIHMWLKHQKMLTKEIEIQGTQVGAGHLQECKYQPGQLKCLGEQSSLLAFHPQPSPLIYPGQLPSPLAINIQHQWHSTISRQEAPMKLSLMCKVMCHNYSL